MRHVRVPAHVHSVRHLAIVDSPVESFTLEHPLFSEDLCLRSTTPITSFHVARGALDDVWCIDVHINQHGWSDEQRLEYLAWLLPNVPRTSRAWKEICVLTDLNRPFDKKKCISMIRPLSRRRVTWMHGDTTCRGLVVFQDMYQNDTNR